MKNIFLILSIIIAFSLNSTAQKHQFGVQTGFGLSGLHDKDKVIEYSLGESKLGFGYSINLFYSYKFNNKIGLTVEPGYLLHAYEIDYTSPIFEGDFSKSTTKQNYISMPIILNWYFSDKFYLFIGPEIQYIASAITKLDGEKHSYNNLDQRLRLNGIIGLNYQLLQNMDIGLRYANEIPYRSDYSFYVLNYYAHFVVKYSLPVLKNKE